MKPAEIDYFEGWYGEERDDSGTFRWMGRLASLRIKGALPSGTKYLLFTAGHSFPGHPPPKLQVRVNGRTVLERPIPAETMHYCVEFRESEDISIGFSLSSIFSIPEDTRELGIIVRDMKIMTPEEQTWSYGEGWHTWEGGSSFRWMSKCAQLMVPASLLAENRFLFFEAFSEYDDFSQRLGISLNGGTIADIPLLKMWNSYSISLGPMPETSDPEAPPGLLRIFLYLNKPIPEALSINDTRELGIQVRNVAFHDDPVLNRDMNFFVDNAALNYREMMEGRTRLASFPLYLGIDIMGHCNMKPPCVYCEWDLMKKAEGPWTRVEVDETTLEGYGPFFLAARNLVNCSIGEPLVHPRLKQILDLCHRHHKYLEMATNALSLTEETVAALAGKRIDLYVSLDAASRETYAKIRNDRWDDVISGLRRLKEARQRAGGLPRLLMVFMPMRVNRHELEDYFRLCRDLDADTLILRPLNFLYDENVEVERAGYRFQYHREHLTGEEIREILTTCERFSKEYRVEIGNQFDFGKG